MADNRKLFHYCLEVLNWNVEYIIKIITDVTIYASRSSRSNMAARPGSKQTSVQVSRVLDEQLQMPSMKPERAHQVGLTARSQPRPLVARVKHYADRKHVLRNIEKLKRHGIIYKQRFVTCFHWNKKKARKEGKIPLSSHVWLYGRTGQLSSSSVKEVGSLHRNETSRVTLATGTLGSIHWRRPGEAGRSFSQWRQKYIEGSCQWGGTMRDQWRSGYMWYFCYTSKSLWNRNKNKYNFYY